MTWSLDKREGELDNTHDILEVITAFPVVEDRLPWDWLTDTVSSQVQNYVSSIILFEHRQEDIVREVQEFRTVFVKKLLFLTKEEWLLLQREFKFIIDLFSADDWSITDNSFIRAYEWFAISREIQELLLNQNITIDFQNVVKYFRKWLKEEPDRENILWLLLSCISSSIKLKEV